MTKDAEREVKVIMIKIQRHKKRQVPTLNMTSMPDLIFTVLFFFMIVTHMRSEEPKVKVETPTGTELSKPSTRRGLVNLYVGQDTDGNIIIQMGKKIVTVNEVGYIAASMRDGMREGDEEAPLTINIMADKNTPMGVISDIKHELRKAGALNIRYNAEEESRK